MGILATCKLDDANWHLRQGTANEENARAYVEMWNREGMRLTEAELYFANIAIDHGRITLKAPQIRIYDPE